MLPLITALLPILGSVIDKVIPDKDAADKAKLEMQAKIIDAANTGALAQIEVNKMEAASPDPFTSRARPFILWVCGAAFAWQFVLAPVVMWIGFVMGSPLPKPPTFDSGVWELMFGMLGLGSLRTYEKIKGVAS